MSRVAHGVMTFGTGEFVGSVMNNTDQAQADILVNTCLDAGVNLFDTADMYQFGQTEEMLGKALGKRRNEIVISTKAGWRSSARMLSAGLSARHLIEAVEASLKRLGTGWIELPRVCRRPQLLRGRGHDEQDDEPIFA